MPLLGAPMTRIEINGSEGLCYAIGKSCQVRIALNLLRGMRDQGCFTAQN
jgi:hypothetical protein